MAYVYRHIRLDKNEPFYIGIGSDSDGEYKRAIARSKSIRNNIWNKITAKTDYEVEILLDDLTWEEACEKEIEFISLYGRIDKKAGSLCNLTDGGEGILGLICSKETKEKISNSKKEKPSGRKGTKHSQSTKEKLSEINKQKFIEGYIHPMTGKKHKTESILKMKNKIISDEQKKIISEVNKGRVPPNAKKVIRESDGKIYDSIQDASKDNNVSSSSLLRFLNGTYENKTGLKFLIPN
jgi:hypothetical protein